MMWDGGWSWWGWVLMTLVMLAVVVTITWGVLIVVRGDPLTQRGISSPSATDTAERILAERYAKGEIDAVEYHQRLDDIRQHTHSGTSPRSSATG